MSFKSFLRESLPQNANLFVDMDGVICDWQRSAKNVTGRTYGNQFVGDLERIKILSKESLEESMQFWVNMPWTPGGERFWNSIRHLNPYILSAYDRLDPHSKVGKYQWCVENLHIPKSRIILVPSSNDKPKYSGQNKILVDDFAHNIQAWIEAGGIGIQYHSTDQAIGQLQDTLRGAIPSWNK